MNNTLYVIDVYSLLFQVFHAIPAMTSPSGQPTNAVFGMTRDILTILREKQPSHLFCAMDSKGPGVRKKIYAEYKANRSEMPDDLRIQIPQVFELFEGFQIPVVSIDGWEADDVIATVVSRAQEAGFTTVIVTSDKDIRQLLCPNTQMYNVRKNTYFGVDDLQATWGIRPDQVVDFQSLVGDSVDNVPGVPLVGPKKATALLEQFGDLESVLAHADEVRGAKLKENLKTYAEQAKISRELVRLRTDLPMEIDWEQLQVSAPDADRLVKLFQDCGFRRFQEDILQLTPGGEVPSEAAPPEYRWETIDTPKQFDKFLAELKQQSEFCFDLETTSLDAVRADIVGWAFCWEAGIGYYLPVDGPPGQPQLKRDAVLAALKPILEDPAVTVCNQNIKYDMIVLKRVGVNVQGLGVDPMVGNYLLNAGARSHSLETLAAHYLGRKMIPISELIGKGQKQKKMFEVDIEKAAEYAAEDAEVAWQVSRAIAKELKQQNLWELYWDLERPLIDVLAEMEFTGICVDVAELKSQSEAIGTRLTELVAEIYELAEQEFNIDSPLQLRKILFDELNLPVLKKTKTGPSTDQSVLERLAPLHPLPAKIIEHRHLGKLKGTYLDALPTMVNPETGRIHASFNQVVAATGRLSSSDPNLQNIPIRTAEGRRVRKAFVPADENWVLLCADYSQIELRMLAHFSEDPVLLDAFSRGEDIHSAVARDVYGVATDEVTSEQRRVAKAVNFGVIYGQSAFGLAASLGIGQDDAAAYIAAYFERHAGVDQFMRELLDDCARKGYVSTILGRRRTIEGVRSGDFMQKNMPERTAVNTVIQGSAADLIKQAMINLHRRLHEEQHTGRLLLQIHDELVLEVPRDDLASLTEIVRHEMEHAFELLVPLTVDMAVGPNWLETEKL